MRVLFLVAFLLSNFGFSQEKREFKALELNLPKNTSEPKKLYFGKDIIDIEGKKCFSYQVFHNVERKGKKMRNYYEIRDLQDNILFTGDISDNNSRNKWSDEITFVLLDNKLYNNASIIGRRDLILNFASNQVLGNDCSINLENLKLFYEKSNENN